MLDFKKHKKVALLFSGGPAPSANAVISSVALNFINAKVPIIGFFFGFEFLENYDHKNRYCLAPNVHYQALDSDISSIRNRRGVFLKTSRANPGRLIKSPEDLQDPEKTKKLHNILQALDSLGIGCLITIGGDDTLKTANFLARLGLPVIHIPKTIDNDYFGIAWTFGYWSSVQASQEALLNLKADSESTSSYFIVELMGRKAGWLTYAAGIAGEAVLMISTEDNEEEVLDIDKIAEKIVDTMLWREKNDKYYGVICVAEGLADKLPGQIPAHRKGPPRQRHPGDRRSRPRRARRRRGGVQEPDRAQEKDHLQADRLRDPQRPAHQLRRGPGQHARLRRLQAFQEQAVRLHGLGLGQFPDRGRALRRPDRSPDPADPPAQRAARQRFLRAEGSPLL